MSEWKEYKLGEICDIKGGKRLPMGHELIIKRTNHPYIKARDIRNGKISTENLEFISENTHNLISRYIVRENDVCLTIVANIGDVGIVPKELDFANLTENAIRLTSISKIINPKYLNYLLASENYKKYCEGLAAGAAQAKLGIYKIKTINIKLPPLAEQNIIATILTAYDDLIENNNRRISILEQMAEQIYKEWFVRMRFPGYENVEFEKSVPKGWRWKKVEEVFKTSSGGTPSRQKEQEYYNGEIDWIKTGELKDSFIFDSEEKITVSGLNNSSAKLFPPNTLLMAMYGVNIGQLGISVKPSTANQAVCVFAPKVLEEYSLYYSFYFFKSIRAHLFNISMGAAQQNLSQDIIKRIDFLQPDSKLLEKFDNAIKPTFELKLKLMLQTQTLKQTRDLLLPRLISGKLRVKEAEKGFF